MLALYGSLLCIQLNYMVVSGQFFFCLVCGFLKKKGKKIIRGGTGSTWGHNFYMGTQNVETRNFMA